MDFGLTEEQAALQDLAKKIFRGLCPVESLPAVEAEGEGIHRIVWDGLMKAQLLGLAIPEDVGGGGMGLVEICLLVEQAADAACPIPLLPTLVMAGLPIGTFGTAAQRGAWLSPVIGSGAVLTAALVESGTPVMATPDGADFVVSGVKDCVPALHLASRVLVPARTPAGAVVLLALDPREKGVTVERQVGTSGEVLGRLILREVRAPAGDVLGGPDRGAEILEWTLERAHVAQCALELGLARRALILTANYSKERHQFGRPIGTFQAVAQRAGDAYVDVETMRLVTYRAAWLLDQGADARREVAVAKMVTAEAGHRVVSAAAHIHGGIGFDRDYPLHRYFLMSKQNEFTLGSASHHTARLGRMLSEK